MLVRITRDTVISAGRFGQAGSLEEVPDAVAAVLIRLGKAAREAYRPAPEAASTALPQVAAGPVQVSPPDTTPTQTERVMPPIVAREVSGLAALPWRELRQLAASLGVGELRGGREKLIKQIEEKGYSHA